MVIAFSSGNIRFTYSTHLGVMCHFSSRCRRQRVSRLNMLGAADKSGLSVSHASLR